MHADLLTGIGLSTVVAAVFAIVANKFKQPPILAYLLAGIVLGPAMGFGLISDPAAIQGISEIGLVLLLYMIGLEIDIKKLAASGKSLIFSGALQFLLSLPLGLAFFMLLGFAFGNGRFDALYLAVGLGLSSTMIVVKLLYDKGELPTLPGRLTLGILVFQDLWAIVFLAVQPNLQSPQLGTLALSFVNGAALVGASLLFTRHVLARLFKAIAHLPELMLVAAIAWCFLVSGVAEAAGLSREMGALVAGISLSTLPYHVDVVAKVINIRDFFVTLFFVGLGLQIPVPTLGLMGYAVLGTLFLFATRLFVITPILYFLGNGMRASLLPAINLAQLSEFSLVIAALGLSMKHIDPYVVSVLTSIFTLTAVTSTYAIKYNHQLQCWFSAGMRAMGLKDIGAAPAGDGGAQAEKPVVFLGFFREASSIMHELEHLPVFNDTPFTSQVRVIDLSPVVYGELRRRNVQCTYGDVTSPETLSQAGLHGAQVLVCSLSDTILRGSTNANLLHSLRQLCPQAFIVVTADTVPGALALYRQSADFVFIPRIHSAQRVAQVIADATVHHAEVSQAEIESLSQRNEVLA